MDKNSILPVKEFMIKDIVSVKSNTTIKQTVKQMYEKHVGAAIVLENNSLVGIITHRDIAIAVSVFEKALNLPVSEIMSSPVLHVSPDESIIKTAEIMTSKNIHRLPIVDQGKVIGIISSTDLAILFSMYKEEDLKKIFGPSLNI